MRGYSRKLHKYSSDTMIHHEWIEPEIYFINIKEYEESKLECLQDQCFPLWTILSLFNVSFEMVWDVFIDATESKTDPKLEFIRLLGFLAHFNCNHPSLPLIATTPQRIWDLTLYSLLFDGSGSPTLNSRQPQPKWMRWPKSYRISRSNCKEE